MRREIREKRLKKVVLGFWEEYVGYLRGIEEGTEGRVAVFDDATVVLCGKLGDLRQHIGKRVLVLCTDELEGSACTRVILDRSQLS